MNLKIKKKPWDFWTPGALSIVQTRILCEQKYIINTEDLDNSVGYSSIDLHLSGKGFIMTKGSVKPSGKNYLNEICDSDLVEEFESKNGLFTLEPKSTYLFKLREQLDQTNELSKAKFYGMATAKSSVGRVDVLARLIIDGMDKYEYFDPKGLKDGNGEMFLEITPMTYPVIVKEGISLSQLRIFYGNPENSKISSELFYKTLFDKENVDDGSLSVDLDFVEIAGENTSAFSTIKGDASKLEPINLWKPEKGSNGANPENYWKRIKKDKNDRITIEKDVFYILKSEEKISVPAGIAIYCRAIDETIGEMRIHYAGFAHPFFGTENNKRLGTPLIFEVRGHNVKVSLKHGEKMAHLVCYRLSEDNKWSEKNKEEKIDKKGYNYQTLKLSNFFREWSDN